MISFARGVAWCRLLVLLAGIVLPAAAQSTLFYAKQGRVLRERGDYFLDPIEVTTTTTYLFYFASDYRAQAAIISPGQVSAFQNNGSFSAHALFDNRFGFQSVTLSPGSYYIGARNTSDSANTTSIELDPFEAYAPEGTTYEAQCISGSENVDGNGGRLTHNFTIQDGFAYTLDGCNTGLECYIIPRSELSNFNNSRTFEYYTDYSSPSGSNAAPGYYHLQLPPGEYTLVFRNSDADDHAATYLMLAWRITGGGGGGGGGGGESDIQMSGSIGYDANPATGRIVLTADRVANLAPSGTSGTLRLELWATLAPYSGTGGISGYRVATHQIGSLDGGAAYTGISSGSIPYSAPPAGTYSATMVVSEYTADDGNDGFVLRDYLTFSNPMVVGGGSGGGSGGGGSGGGGGGGSSDDHGNTSGSATAISPNSSRSGQLNSGSDVDYFSFSVSGTGTLRVYTTSTLDTRGALYGGGGQLLASDDDGGDGLNFLITRTVSSGTYYVAVRPYSASHTGNYTLHVEFSGGSSGGVAAPAVVPAVVPAAAALRAEGA